MHLHKTRLIPAALFIGALAGAPAIGAVATQPSAPVAQTECPNSMTEGIYIGGCLPGVDPNPQMVDERGPDRLPTLRGIPCAGSECLGLSRALEDQPSPGSPDAEVRTHP